jgi:hypothetical protein
MLERRENVQSFRRRSASQQTRGKRLRNQRSVTGTKAMKRTFLFGTQKAFSFGSAGISIFLDTAGKIE